MYFCLTQNKPPGAHRRRFVILSIRLGILIADFSKDYLETYNAHA